MALHFLYYNFARIHATKEDDARESPRERLRGFGT
jgi:hypothetical protein